MNKSQRVMNEKFAYLFVVNLFVILGIMIIVSATQASENNQIEDESKIIYESWNDHNVMTSSANTSPDQLNIVEEKPIETYCKNLSEKDKYLLARIAMAEAEGESIETKILVILVVLNRVESKQFPNTVEEVIFQNRNGVYQFTPVVNGRWNKVEPNEECWKAVEIVNTTENDLSEGALYFEACSSSDNWHSRNLEFVCQSDNTRFYK